jgi:hypothetical protein
VKKKKEMISWFVKISVICQWTKQTTQLDEKNACFKKNLITSTQNFKIPRINAVYAETKEWFIPNQKVDLLESIKQFFRFPLPNSKQWPTSAWPLKALMIDNNLGNDEFKFSYLLYL